MRVLTEIQMDNTQPAGVNWNQVGRDFCLGWGAFRFLTIPVEFTGFGALLCTGVDFACTVTAVGERIYDSE